jgi:hypothetical protein
MVTRLDNRQSRQRSVLDQISDSTDLKLDNILSLMNDELTMPLRLRANSTPNLVLNVGAISVTTSDSGEGHQRTKTIQPIQGLIPTFTGGTLTFPASSGGAVTGSGITLSAAFNLTISSGNWRKILLSINSVGEITLLAGTEGASEVSATLPEADFGTLSIGYLSMQNIGGVIQNITNARIYQFLNGGRTNTIPIVAGTTGTLSVARGGTGLTAVGSALQVLRTNAGATALEWATAGSGDVVGPASATDSVVASFDGITGKLLKNSTKVTADIVTGPASSTDNALVRFDGTTGKLVQNSGVEVDDSGNIKMSYPSSALGRINYQAASGDKVFLLQTITSTNNYGIGVDSSNLVTFGSVSGADTWNVKAIQYASSGAVTLGPSGGSGSNHTVYTSNTWFRTDGATSSERSGANFQFTSGPTGRLANLTLDPNGANAAGGDYVTLRAKQDSSFEIHVGTNLPLSINSSGAVTLGPSGGSGSNHTVYTSNTWFRTDSATSSERSGANFQFTSGPTGRLADLTLDPNGANAAGGDYVTLRAKQDSSFEIHVGTNLPLSINSSGAVTLGPSGSTATNCAVNGAASVTHGVVFPASQNAVANANTLDDYEEGTFTPILTASVTNPTNYGRNGRYTKIGNLVHVEIYITFDGTSTFGSGIYAIDGLPFAPAATHVVIGWGLLFKSGSGWYEASMEVPAGGSSGYLIYTQTNSYVTHVNPNTWNSGTYFKYQFTYRVA